MTDYNPFNFFVTRNTIFTDVIMQTVYLKIESPTLPEKRF